MDYYVRTKKELSLELSAAFPTFELAEEKLKKMQIRTREHSSVIPIPDIRSGLRLYRNGQYWRTIIGESSSVWFCNRTDDKKEQMDDAFQKDTVLRWFVEELLDPREEYEEGNFIILKGFSGQEDLFHGEEE